MLTNDEIEQMKGVVRKCIYGIPDSEGQVVRDTLDKIVAELLTLREAVAPQVAEVDALMEQINEAPNLSPRMKSAAMKGAGLARQAILARERAENNEIAACDALVAEHNNLTEQINTLAAQLSAIRDAGDEEVERLTNEIQYQLRTEDILKLRDIAIARGQQLREAREEIERLKEEMETLVSEAEERANERGRQIAILTAERDDAREEVERMKNLLRWCAGSMNKHSELDEAAEEGEGCAAEVLAAIQKQRTT